MEAMLKNQFNLDIPVFVIAKKELEEILSNAPEWWGNENKDIYDNLIFIIPPPHLTKYSESWENPRKNRRR